MFPEGWKSKTCIMGIINTTPDSFSDGGKYDNELVALDRAKFLINEGADVIDIGAQSTRPGAEPVGLDEELKRLINPLSIIRSNLPEAIISIDTYLSKVAEKSIELGANWINDVSGGRTDPDMLKVAASANCPFVLTHSRGDSQSMQFLTHYENIVSDVIDELSKSTHKALKAGIKEKNIIWDPGLGFAKTTEQNISLIKNIEQFSSQPYPILIGPSRKSFIGEVLNENSPLKRIWGTSAVVSKCVQAKVDIVRVHDVKEIYQTIQMSSEIW